VAGVGAIATALVVQACADGGLTGTAAAPPPKAEISRPGALETSRGIARTPGERVDVA